MNITLLSEKYTPDIGGLAISTERLARLLTSAGHTVRVFAPTTGLLPSEQRTLSIGGVSVTRFGAHKRVDDTLVDWFELITEEHKREPFDILHAYFLPQAGFVAAYAGKYLNLPSVVSIRGNDIERAAFDPAKFSHVMYALTNAGAVTTNASELAKKTKAFFDREIFLIPNGIDTEHFKPMERNEALAESLGLGVVRNGIPHTTESAGYHPAPRIPVIGFAGELREKKGLRALLSGYAQVAKNHPATLLIVGEIRAGEDKRAFEEFQSSNPQLPTLAPGASAGVTITGSVPHKDMPAYYSLMDVFVHPSLRDGMPNAVLEAMACGVPVVVTPVGGILDVIKDRENGMLVPVNGVNALGQAIEMILTDELLRKNLSNAARRTIIENYRPEMELNSNLEVYRKLT